MDTTLISLKNYHHYFGDKLVKQIVIHCVWLLLQMKQSTIEEYKL